MARGRGSPERELAQRTRAWHASTPLPSTRVSRASSVGSEALTRHFGDKRWDGVGAAAAQVSTEGAPATAVSGEGTRKKEKKGGRKDKEVRVQVRRNKCGAAPRGVSPRWAWVRLRVSFSLSPGSSRLVAGQQNRSRALAWATCRSQGGGGMRVRLKNNKKRRMALTGTSPQTHTTSTPCVKHAATTLGSSRRERGECHGTRRGKRL